MFPSTVPVPSKAGTAGPACPCFYACRPRGISFAFCKMVPRTKLAVRERSGCSPRASALCDGAAALSGAKPPWKWSPVQAGALLAGLCIYAYIYIYAQPDERQLLGCAESPPAVPAAGGCRQGLAACRSLGRSRDASGRGCCSTVAEAMPGVKSSLRVFGVKQLSPSRELGPIWAGKSIRATP